MPLIASDGIQVIDVTEDSIRIAGEPINLFRTRVSPSRLRFRPPSRLALGFRLQPLGTASTYSRSVLGASGNLRNVGCSRKTRRNEVRAICAKTLRSGDVGRVVVRPALAPEPERAADSRETGRDRPLVRPHRLARAARDGVARLLLRDPLADLPDRPAEDGVPLVEHAHRGASLPGRRACVTQGR